MFPDVLFSLCLQSHLSLFCFSTTLTLSITVRTTEGVLVQRLINGHMDGHLDAVGGSERTAS